MKIVILKIAIVFLNIIYFVMKLFPTKKKITFISRQGNQAPLDFLLLKEGLEHQLQEYQIVLLSKKLTQQDNIIIKIKYCFHIIRQMYHIATSKLVILDSYCIPVCLLHHKKELKVIQMWHSVGTMKKFGYSVLDKKEGSKYKIAKTLKMHHNYDYVLCSSKAYQEHLMEGFQISADQLVFIPLPRLDLLKDDTYRQEITSRIYQKYPKLTKKKTILYAPTFRKNYDITKNVKKLINQVDFSKYNLIIKLHPLDTAQIQDDRVIIDPFFTSFDMLFVSDFVISDYSCFIYEALFLEKPIFLYDFDLKKYMSARDVYIDYEKDLPFYKSENPKNIIKAIENKNYSKLKLKKFKEKYIHMTDDTCVNRLVSFIKQILM